MKLSYLSFDDHILKDYVRSSKFLIYMNKIVHFSRTTKSNYLSSFQVIMGKMWRARGTGLKETLTGVVDD